MAATSETTLSWLYVSLQNFDFKEPDDFSSVGLRFDDSFNKNDEGQLQTRITEIYETELMKGLRAKASERKTDIPNEFHEYYDTCKKPYINSCGAISTSSRVKVPIHRDLVRGICLAEV